MADEKRRMPPEPGDMELSFAQFHPLDHWPSLRGRCGNFYGGWRRHLYLAWTFKWRGAVRTSTLCKLGLHGPYRSGMRRVAGGWQACWPCCVHCYKAQSGKPAGWQSEFVKRNDD